MSHPYSSPNAAINSSSSTISTNATADGLIGPGRTLGLLYGYLGRKIEARLNRFALSRGCGPEAAYDRIELRIKTARSEPGTSLRRSRRAVEILLEKGELVKDCQRLLKYAQSDIAPNQCLALQRIATLAIDDPVFRTFFNHLGALDFLLQFKPRVARCDLEHRDLLLSWSRTALISLSETEVNVLGQQLDPDLSNDFEKNLSESVRVMGVIDKLVDHLSDPDTSFIALRYIRGCGEISQLARVAQFRDDVISLELFYVNRLARQVLEDPTSIESDCADDIFWEYCSKYKLSDGPSKLVSDAIFTNLAKTSHSSKVVAAFLELLSRDDVYENGVYTLLLYLSALTGLDLRADDFRLKEYLQRVEALSQKYPNRDLTHLWDVMSNGLMVTRLKTIQAGSCFNVVETPRRKRICQDMMEYFASSGIQTRNDALSGVKYLLAENRYFRQSMTEILVKTFNDHWREEPENRKFTDDVAWQMHGLSIPDFLYQPQYNNFTPVMLYDGHSLYRHRSTDRGQVHITVSHVSTSSPCVLCTQLGIWDDWQHNAEVGGCERLYRLIDDGHIDPSRLAHLRLQLDSRDYADELKNTASRPFGHIPILAGVNDLGERGYISQALCGCVSVLTEAGSGSRMDGCHFSHCFVKYHPLSDLTLRMIVLQDDLYDEAEAAVQAFEGVDATGPFFWKRADW